MISYETYKMLHLFALLSVFTGIGFVAQSAPILDKKWGKMVLGFFSFMIFVAGMGLVARIGIKHGESFPHWILIKIFNWFLLNVLFVLLFKCKKISHKGLIAGSMLLVGWLSIWVVIHRPI